MIGGSSLLTLLTVLWVVVSAALITITAISSANVLTFPRLGRGAAARTRAASDPPRVSVLIPARNEAAVIDATVRRLLAQTYPHLELLVLDDDSDDGTAAVARGAAAGDDRLRVLDGAPLPPGWLGKNWACHQLAGAASGDVLIFTDADVIWEPGGVAAVVDQMQHHDAALVTVWPTQQTHTWAERLTVALMALVVVGYLPEILVRRTPWPVFAAANGQCVAFRRAAYAAVGGHTAVRAQIVEDVALARATKRTGRRLVMADGAGLVGCRMYHSWDEVRDGYAKNIIAGHGGLLPLAFSTIFHWLVFFAPWLWLALGGVVTLGPAWPLWPLLLIALGVGVRALTAVMTRQRLRDALLMPVSVLLMTRITLRAVVWRLGRGDPQWKGRSLPTASPDNPTGSAPPGAPDTAPGLSHPKRQNHS